MAHRRSWLRPALTLTVALALIGGAGCTEKNMGGSAGGDGWTKVDTGARSTAPAAPLGHAEAVNVTYFYLPG